MRRFWRVAPQGLMHVRWALLCCALVPLLILLLLSHGCARHTQVAPRIVVPQRPAQWVPGHLPLLVRLELASLRKRAPFHFDGALAQLLGGRLPPGGVQLVEKSHRLWLGARWTVGRAGLMSVDSVIVLEGAFAEMSRAAWGPRFLPARELGARIRRYDARDDTRRGDAARIYEQLGQMLICASAAEVDPLERVVEGGWRERISSPPGEGEFAWLVSGSQLAAWLEPSSPKAARVLAASLEWSGQMASSEGLVVTDSAISFADARSAERALTALRLVTRALPSLEPEWGISLDFARVDSDVTLHAETRWETIVALLANTGSGSKAEMSPGAGR